MRRRVPGTSKLVSFKTKVAIPLPTTLMPFKTDVIPHVMGLARKAVYLSAATSLGGCNNVVPAWESVAYEPSVQNVLNIASGDRFICVRAMADGPCNRSNAQAIISGSAEADDVSVQWDGGQNVIVSVGSGRLEESSRTAMNGKMTIEYQ